MKFSKPAAIAVAVAALIGGGVAADAATTTSPVKLCSNKVIQTVSVPKNGTCPSNATTFYVASQADVSALAGRMDAAEASNTSEEARIAALEAALKQLSKPVILVSTSGTFDGGTPTPFSGGPGYGWTAKGAGLKPSSSVKASYPDNTLSYSPVYTTVDDQGNFEFGDGALCRFAPVVRIEAIARDGSPVSTDYRSPSC